MKNGSIGMSITLDGSVVWILVGGYGNTGKRASHMVLLLGRSKNVNFITLARYP